MTELPAGQTLLCVGSYTGRRGTGTGITTFAVDPVTGALQLRSTYPMESPSYLQAHPWLPVVYATSEARAGRVSTFQIDPTGQLALLAQCSSGGAGPCHCAVAPDGTHLIVSNYDDGTMVVLPLDEDGIPRAPTVVTPRRGSGPDLERQCAAHPHMTAALTDRAILLTDLGTDEIVRYEVNNAETMTPTEQATMPPGTGPRQVALISGGEVDGPHDQQLIVLGELSSSLTLLHRGLGTPVDEWFSTPSQGPDCPAHRRNYPAHIEVAPGGAVVYVTNRGADCVTSFYLEQGRLEFVDRVSVGAWPRHLAVLGPFLYVAAEHGQTIDLIRANHATGALQHLGAVADVSSPTCVRPITVPPHGGRGARRRTGMSVKVIQPERGKSVSNRVAVDRTGWEAPVCGMTWGFTGVRGSWTTPAAEQSMTALTDLNVNWVTFAYAAVQETAQSTTIPFRDTPSLTDDEVRATVRRAQGQGPRAQDMPEPMVNVADGTWRAYIGFFGWDVPGEPTWDDWFRSYREHIVHHARLAAELDIDLFCIGCEAVRADSQEALWRELITEVRSVYGGPITYNCDKYQEDHVTWWDAVDVISASGYTRAVNGRPSWTASRRS